MNQATPQIGYACINLDVSPAKYRTCRLRNVTDDTLRELIQHNLLVLEKTIDYNIAHDNHMFRITSSLIPFGSSDYNTIHWQEEFAEDFQRIKMKIKQGNIRVSCHPGQYTIINSPREEVVSAAIKELEYHADILELLSNGVADTMVLHVGGIYGDKEKAMQSFITTYHGQLSDRVKRSLVIENDDRYYTVEDVLYISNRTNMPVVFDNLHHEINPSLEHLTPSEIMHQVTKTWNTRNIRPKVHYSQQSPGKRKGAHSETIDLNQFLNDYHTYFRHVNVDIMLEVKDKNRSFSKVNEIMILGIKNE